MSDSIEKLSFPDQIKEKYQTVTAAGKAVGAGISEFILVFLISLHSIDIIIISGKYLTSVIILLLLNTIYLLPLLSGIRPSTITCPNCYSKMIPRDYLCPNCQNKFVQPRTKKDKKG